MKIDSNDGLVELGWQQEAILKKIIETLLSYGIVVGKFKLDLSVTASYYLELRTYSIHKDTLAMIAKMKRFQELYVRGDGKLVLYFDAE